MIRTRLLSRSILSVALLLPLVWLPGRASAQQTHKVSLDVKDLDVTKAIEMLFKVTNYNKVVAPM